jgi:hypothetical protein
MTVSVLKKNSQAAIVVAMENDFRGLIARPEADHYCVTKKGFRDDKVKKTMGLLGLIQDMAVGKEIKYDKLTLDVQKGFLKKLISSEDTTSMTFKEVVVEISTKNLKIHFDDQGLYSKVVRVIPFSGSIVGTGGENTPCKYYLKIPLESLRKENAMISEVVFTAAR